LARAQTSGHTVTLAWLRTRVDLGLDEMEEILDRLVQANIARRSGKNAWLLSRAPQDISTAEIFRLFVFDAGTPAETQSQIQSAYQTLLGKLDVEHRSAFAPTLADLTTDAKT